MTIKGVCLVRNVIAKSSTEVRLEVAYCNLPQGSEPQLSDGTLIVDIEPSWIPATKESVIKTAVKTYMQTQGISFGLFDNVVLLGSLL